MQKFDFKKLIPYVAGIIIFILVTIMFFNPLIDGKRLKQTDVSNHEGMSKEIADYRAAHNGEEPLWTNSMFGGMPAYQISVWHKSNLVQYVDRIFHFNLPSPADFVFIGMVGFFFLLLVLGVNPWMAIVGSIAFAFSSYFLIILEAGHNSKAHAIAYMAPVLAAIILTFKKKYLLGGSLTALFLALELNAGHPQISYYLMMIVLILGIAEFIRSIKSGELVSFFKASAVLIIAAIIAVGTSASNYITTAEYSPATIRGASELSFDKHIQSAGLDRDYATQWSYGIGETWSLMIPNVRGGASVPIQMSNPEVLEKMSGNEYVQYVGQSYAYCGEQPFTSGPVYVGAIIFFLFILGLFIVKGELKWVLLIATILSILLSWGKNFMGFTNLFFDYFPAYNKFRAVSMTLVIAELTIVMMAFLAVKEILLKPEIIKEKKVLFFISFGLTGGISLLFWLVPGMFFTFQNQAEIKQFSDLIAQQPNYAVQYQGISNAIKEAREMIFKADALRSFAFILAAAALVYVYSLKKFNRNIFVAVLGIFIIFDLWFVDRRYLNDENYEEKTEAASFQPSIADQMILQDKSLDYRVFNTTVSPFNDATTSYFHKSIGGYHGAKLRRYQDVIDYHLGVGNMEVINMLNTKYYIGAGQDQQPIAQQNPGALGNAWFVPSVTWVENPDQEILHLGNLLEIKNLKPNNKIQVFGREFKNIDTILTTSAISIKSVVEGVPDEVFSLRTNNFVPGQSYIVGSNPQDSTPNYISVAGSIKNTSEIAAQQFEAKLIYSFDPKNTAIIDKKFESTLKGFNPQTDSNARIILESYQPNHLVYQSHTSSEQLAVFSEIYYEKGWNAFIDGKKADYVRANYILRAMRVPAGDHKIEFKFESESYKLGSTLSLISSLLLFAMLAVGIFFYWKSENQKNPQAV